YCGCSQGVGLFPGNFFSTLLCGFWDIPGFRSTIRPLIGGRPRFSRGLHSVGLVASVAFLGYIISAVGFSMDPQKVSAVLQWPRPVVFGPFSAFWDLPTIIGSLSGTSPRWP
ncbi:unnamed protein product, partial [Staurois parvus]